jgi:hypothetical protein
MQRTRTQKEQPSAAGIRWAGPRPAPEPVARVEGASPRVAGHSFGNVSVHPEAGDTARKISGSGTGKVNIDYVPETSDKSTKIVFLQVMREALDGKVKKPGDILPAFAYQDADTTSDGFHVDYVSGEADPYYNGDDAKDGGTQGNGPAKVTAKMDDTPTMRDTSFPAGSTHLRYEFRTSAFSAAGPDAGRYFGWVDWTFDKVKGKPATTKVGSTGSYGPGRYWQNAIKLWSTNHGFTLPTYKP